MIALAVVFVWAVLGLVALAAYNLAKWRYQR